MAECGANKFSNNRFLRNGDSPKVHSFEKLTSELSQKRKIKLLPLVDESGSDGKYIVADNVSLESGDTISINSNFSDGYEPAQLSVQDLLPEKQDGVRQLPSNGDVVIVTAHDSSVLGEIKFDAHSNPYNGFNRKFYSILCFPPCAFLFYIFCMPAMMYMKQSDIAFIENDFKLAKRNGTIGTVFYFGGVVFALCFYAFIALLVVYITKAY